MLSCTPALRWHRLVVIVLLCALLPGFGSAVAAQSDSESDSGFQEDGEYALKYGATITWDAPWEADEEQSGYLPELLGDYLLFESDEARIEFLALPGVGGIADSMEFELQYTAGQFDDPELLELEGDKQDLDAVMRMEQAGEPWAAYVTVFLSPDLATAHTVILAAPAATFDETLESANEAIALEGEPLLGDVDSDAVVDLLEDGEAIPFPWEPAAEQDVNTDETPESDEPSDNDDKKLPDEDAGDEPGEETPEGDPTPESDLEDLGLVEDGVYESPQFGTEVTFASSWLPNPEYVVSDTDGAVDRLGLDRSARELSFFAAFFDGAETSPEAWVDGFETSVEAGDIIEIFDIQEEDDGYAVFYTYDRDGTILYGMTEVYAIDRGDITVVVEVIGNEDVIAAGFEEVQEDIAIDGDAPFIITAAFPELP